MKIALVHDYLVQYGGAERVLEAFVEIFPEAPIYTIVYDKEAMHGVFADRQIRTSYLQKFPFARKKHRIFPRITSYNVCYTKLLRINLWKPQKNNPSEGLVENV